MLHSIAKVAVSLNVDGVTNNLVERLYTNKRKVSPHLSRRFQILGYHKVSPDEHPFFEPLPPDIFEKQMQFLKSCYRVMSLQELVDRSARGEVPERAVAITFDDGYRDNFELAFPILQKYQIPATIFLTTAFIDRQDILWNDKVCFALKRTKRREIAIGCNGGCHFALRTKEERLAAAKEIGYEGVELVPGGGLIEQCAPRCTEAKRDMYREPGSPNKRA